MGAIVDELAEATGADHIVVARRRPDARVLEATLVSARPGVPDSTTLLPIADLEDPVGRRRGARAARTGRDPGRARTRPRPSPPAGSRTRVDGLTARIAAVGPLAGGATLDARRRPRSRASAS